MLDSIVLKPTFNNIREVRVLSVRAESPPSSSQPPAGPAADVWSLLVIGYRALDDIHGAVIFEEYVTCSNKVSWLH